MEKTNLHLALGKLIIEYASDFLSLQSAQQQQNVLTSILRKSHFNGDRASSQKLLDLAAVALERKYCKTLSTQSRHGKDNWKNTILNIRLHSLIPSESFEVKPVVLKEDQQVN
ncbi:hypothetical protein QU864_27140, partial [Escherichia coli]|nr:hypothetical protein [Escherichia coli]